MWKTTNGAWKSNTTRNQAAAEEGKIAVPLPIFEGEYVSVEEAGKICRLIHINYEQYYNLSWFYRIVGNIRTNSKYILKLE